MKWKILIPAAFALTIISGCGAVGVELQGIPTATAGFVAATLPPSSTPAPTATPPPPSPLPAIAPVEGRTTTQVNVRADTSTASASLGVIPQFMRVQIIGREASGNWYQIVYDQSQTGTGWVAAEFVEVEDFDLLPVIGAVEPPVSAETVPSLVPSAVQDGDSLESPIAQAALEPSGARALQVSGEVSAPEGDSEDWIGFSAAGNGVVIEIQCSGNSLQMELWNNGRMLDVFTCGERRAVKVAPGGTYRLRIFESGAAEPRYTRYVVKIERAW